MRHALKTKIGIGAVVLILTFVGLPVLLGVGHGKASAGNQSVRPVVTGGSARTSVSAQRSTPRAAATVKVVPFTTFDLLLLVAGGAVLLVLGANIGRREPREPEAARAEPARAEVGG